MTTPELIEKVLDALTGNAALAAWCAATYGQRPTVILDPDPDDPPGDAAYPLVAVEVPGHQRENSSNRTQEWTVVLGVCLIDETDMTVGGVTVPAGRLRVEALRELAEKAVMDAAVGLVKSDGNVVGEYLRPRFAAASVLTITSK